MRIFSAASVVSNWPVKPSTVAALSPIFPLPVIVPSVNLSFKAAVISIFLSPTLTSNLISDFPNCNVDAPVYSTAVLVKDTAIFFLLATSNGLIWYVAELVFAVYPYAAEVLSVVPIRVPYTRTSLSVTFVRSPSFVS